MDFIIYLVVGLVVLRYSADIIFGAVGLVRWIWRAIT